jgi:hypothetical protein
MPDLATRVSGREPLEVVCIVSQIYHFQCVRPVLEQCYRVIALFAKSWQALGQPALRLYGLGDPRDSDNTWVLTIGLASQKIF